MVDQVAELPAGVKQIREYGFKEVRSAGSITLDRMDLPWMPRKQDTTTVTLARIEPSGVRPFYCGSALVGNLKLLLKEYEGDKDLNERMNKIIYAGIQRYLLGVHDKHTRPIDHPKTKLPDLPKERRREIYELSNGRGVIRGFIMQVGILDGDPIIIIVAKSVAGKGFEAKVFAEISTDDYREIKKRLLGK